MSFISNLIVVMFLAALFGYMVPLYVPFQYGFFVSLIGGFVIGGVGMLLLESFRKS